MSDRDKKLLVYLGALIILAAAYFLLAKPFLDKIDTLSSEKTQLQSELTRKREDFENKDRYEQGIAEADQKIDAILDEFPEDNSDEKSIMFVSHAEADVPVWFNQVKFAEETRNMISSPEGEEGEVQSASDAEAQAEQEAVAQAEGETVAEGESPEGGSGRGDSESGEGAPQAESEEGSPGVADLMYRDTELGLNFETTYDGFKNLLAYIRDYEDRMVIKQIDVTYNDDSGLTSGTLVLSQYAILGPGRTLPEVETKVEDLGKENVFTRKDHGGSILDLIADMYADFLRKITGDMPEEDLDELGTDYFLKVNAVTDNTSGKTIGRADDPTEGTYIASNSNENEDVTFTISGESGSYKVKYKIGKNRYTDNIEKSGDAKIYIRIVSTSRMGEDDESAATVHVLNKSDIPVVVNIEGDDPSNPRVNLIEKSGEVTVNGGQ